MKNSRLSRLSAALALVCVLPLTVSAESLRWTGCGITKKAFMAQIAASYEAQTGTAITLTGGGATKGIRAASAGTTDIGGTCRKQLKDKNGAILPLEKDAELIQVAWDALVVIVHPNNPVADISLADLKKVYDGEITNWQELGGPDQRIGVVARAGKSSGVGHMFRRLVFADPVYEFKARTLKVKSTKPLEQKVEKLKTAIAVDGISSAKKRKVKFLALDGVQPTKENIASGKYPLFRPLYLAVNKRNTSPAVRSFLDYVLNPEGQQIISAQGVVNLEEGQALATNWAARKASLGW